ncbi:MAG: fimbrillin family protein [Bacteroidales bacterium]
MKKSLLFGFAVALTLASCTTNDDVLDTAMQTPMEFSSFVNKGTKAPIGNDGDSAITAHQFGVWGYKYKSSISTPETKDFVTVFGNIPVRHDGVAWTYITGNEKLRYWDKTCTYDFYAYAPKETLTATSSKTATTTTLTVSNFNVNNVATPRTGDNPTKYMDHTDLLIADAIERCVDYNNSQKFTFRHVLSNVSINVKKKAGFAGDVKFTSAVLREVTNKATSYVHTFTKAQGVDQNQGSSTWNISTSGHTSNFSSAQHTTTVISEEGIPLFTEMLMIPQRIGESTFDIVYTINGETFTRTLNFAGTWAANQKITYNIEISANAIEFGVTTVTDWTTPGTTVTPSID